MIRLVQCVFGIALALSVGACHKKQVSEGDPEPPPPTQPSTSSTHPVRITSPEATTSSPIDLNKARKALSELTADDVTKYQEASESKGGLTESTKATLRLLIDLDSLIQANALTDDELRKVAKTVKSGSFASVGADAMRQIIGRQGVNGWDAEAIKNYFGPPTRSDDRRIDYVFDNGSTTIAVTFWLQDGLVVKAW
jgi:hypothetical protein